MGGEGGEEEVVVGGVGGEGGVDSVVDSFFAMTDSVRPVGSKSSAFKDEILALFTNDFSSFTWQILSIFHALK